MQQHQQYLGDVTQGLPEFEELDLKDNPFPGECHFFANNNIFSSLFKQPLIFVSNYCRGN